MASSAYWDIAGWWARRWGKNDAAHANAAEVAEYADGLRAFVAALRHAFPTSVLAWRTTHVGTGRAIGKVNIDLLNAAARALAPERDGLRVASRKGDAVAFYNYEPSGELDPYAIHAGLPAPDVRHVAALWFHV